MDPMSILGSLLVVGKEIATAYRQAKEEATRKGLLTPEQKAELEEKEREAYLIASEPAPPPPASLEAAP